MDVKPMMTMMVIMAKNYKTRKNIKENTLQQAANI